MQKFEQIINGCPTASFETLDKIAYINVYFAMKYNRKNDYIVLQEDLVLRFLKELIQIDGKVSEPYLFYLMLMWPSEPKNDIEDEDEIFHCLQKLVQLEDQNRPCRDNSFHKLPLLFCIGEETGMHKLLPVHQGKMPREAKRFHGKLDGRSSVEMELKTGNVLSVRVADLRFRTLNRIEDVSFYIGFTIFGPVACDYEFTRFSDEKHALRQRVDEEQVK